MTSIKKPPTCSLGYWWLLQGYIGCIPICYAKKNIFVGQMPNVHRKKCSITWWLDSQCFLEKNIAIDPMKWWLDLLFLGGQVSIQCWLPRDGLKLLLDQREDLSDLLQGPGSPQWRMAEPSKRCIFSHQTCELHQKIWGGIRLDTLKTHVYLFFCGD